MAGESSTVVQPTHCQILALASPTSEGLSRLALLVLVSPMQCTCTHIVSWEVNLTLCCLIRTRTAETHVFRRIWVGFFMTMKSEQREF